ncbi:unnamed protein product [Brachionus calyciflorus]|uniref:Uncharacterized protein n=1 Tax=Brachionus calyciflorus TaxID=104777 RepID=A0A814F9C6_9BILA|nr:unnamed protein product [Brachionus calyciflorus]
MNQIEDLYKFEPKKKYVENLEDTEESDVTDDENDDSDESEDEVINETQNLISVQTNSIPHLGLSKKCLVIFVVNSINPEA